MAPNGDPSRVRNGTEPTDRNGVRPVSAEPNTGQVAAIEEASATSGVT